MHIVIVTREYSHEKLPKCGGTGIFYTEYARDLFQKGHQVTVFGVNKINETISHNGVEIVFKKSLFKRNLLLNLIRSVSEKLGLNSLNLKTYELELRDINNQLLKYLQTSHKKIDIIETHDFDGISCFIDKNIAPIVIRCHGSWTILEKEFGYQKVKIGRTHFEKLAFNKHSNIIAVSNYSQKLIEKYFDKKSAIINNSVSIPKVNYLPEITNSIFFYGNISDEKGANKAITIFNEVFKKYPTSTLHFIGRVKDKYKTDLASKTITPNQIQFYGFLEKQKALETLSQASVVIFPSNGETFGLALCEAMLLKKIVIASSIPAFNNLIEHNKNGFLANSIEEFSSQVVSIFENNNSFEFIKENTYLSIAEKYSEENLITKSLEYYESILSSDNS